MDPGSLRPLVGRAVAVHSLETFSRHQPMQEPGMSMVLELSSPGRDRCWEMTAVIVRYHVGIRHYTVTEPAQISECGQGVPARLIPH